MAEEIRHKADILKLWCEKDRAGLELVHPEDAHGKPMRKVVQVRIKESGTVLDTFRYYRELGWTEQGWWNL